MSGNFHMHEQDLLELYQLAEMYESTYREESIESLAGFLEVVREQYRSVTHGKEIIQQTNPRKAGRRPEYTKERNSLIMEQHQKGQSLRMIAKEAGCSVGHVQDILNRAK